MQQHSRVKYVKIQDKVDHKIQINAEVDATDLARVIKNFLLIG